MLHHHLNHNIGTRSTCIQIPNCMHHLAPNHLAPKAQWQSSCDVRGLNSNPPKSRVVSFQINLRTSLYTSITGLNINFDEALYYA